MRTNVSLWWILTGFFALVAIAYTVWSVIWYGNLEWVGTVALFFTALMGALIGFYTGAVHRAQGGELPEDVLTADIDDGDPEIGEFSPWSWWPLVLASSAAVAIIGLAVGAWMVPIGLGIFVVAIIGSAALLLAVRLLTADRWSTLATGGGMMVSTLVFSGEGPGGSVVVPQTEISLVWTFAVPLVVALAVAWPSLPSVDEAATRDA